MALENALAFGCALLEGVSLLELRVHVGDNSGVRLTDI
jgi:hypothetical protein